MKKRILLICFLLISVFSLRSFGQNNTENQDKVSKETKEKFKPGDMILEHIGDAYEWHIVSFGHNKPISIPLPVLVYSKKTGFHAFISSKFEHGEKSFDGLQLAGEESPNKGKIIEMIDGKETRPIDISITKNTLSLFISLAFILWLFISIAKTYQRREGMAPKGIQSLLEPIILFVRDDIAKASIGEKKYVKYTPYLLSIFFFIFLNNLLGLIPIFPGGANLTGNIAITMVLALFTFVITTVNANKNYWKHIINAPGVPWWLKLPVPLMPIVEIIGVFTKPFVLMIRLFANITAGHIIALGFFSLIFIFGEMSAGAGYGMSVLSVSFTVFMSMLELLVAFIQAYVFTLLSALYFGMATEEHH